MAHKSRLRTIRNYATETNVTPQTVRNKIRAKQLKTETIDGIRFVVLPKKQK